MTLPPDQVYKRIVRMDLARLQGIIPVSYSYPGLFGQIIACRKTELPLLSSYVTDFSAASEPLHGYITDLEARQDIFRRLQRVFMVAEYPIHPAAECNSPSYSDGCPDRPVDGSPGHRRYPSLHLLNPNCTQTVGKKIWSTTGRRERTNVRMCGGRCARGQERRNHSQLRTAMPSG